MSGEPKEEGTRHFQCLGVAYLLLKEEGCSKIKPTSRSLSVLVVLVVAPVTSEVADQQQEKILTGVARSGQVNV
jgi:hypothetical protein